MFKVRHDSASPEFRKGSALALTGFTLETLGVVANIPYEAVLFGSRVGLMATLTGVVFFVVGVYYLAKSKGRSPAWAALGLLSLLGWILVAFLEDHTGEETVIVT